MVNIPQSWGQSPGRQRLGLQALYNVRLHESSPQMVRVQVRRESLESDARQPPKGPRAFELPGTRGVYSTSRVSDDGDGEPWVELQRWTYP